MGFMEDFLMSVWVMRINFLLGFVALGLLLFYGFTKEGKDERGRGIIGSACLFGVLLLFVTLNILSFYLIPLCEEPRMMGNAIQLAYTIVMVGIDIAVIIMRKIR